MRKMSSIVNECLPVNDNQERGGTAVVFKPRASPLDMDARRKIWEENRRARERNEVVARAAMKAESEEAATSGTFL